MITLFEIVFGWFVRKPKTPSIKLQSIYTGHTNSSPHDVSIVIINDIRDQTYRRIEEDPKLLKKVNDYGLIEVWFKISVPIGLVVNITHLFYWDGTHLFSMTKESKEMIRASAIEQILN